MIKDMQEMKYQIIDLINNHSITSMINNSIIILILLMLMIVNNNMISKA